MHPMPTHEDKDARLGALLDRYQQLRDVDPDASVGELREDAGADFDEFVQLARCLDELQDGTCAAHPPTASGTPRTAARRTLVITGALAALALTAWWISRPGPAILRVQVHPAADVIVDGLPYREEALDPGRHEVVIALDGFRRHAATIEIEGDDVLHVAHLVPLDPFDEDALRSLAKSYGVEEGAADELLPKPRGAEPPSPDERALRIEHPEAFAMELRRYPPEVRERDDIRYLAARQLFRAGLFAESYAALRDLTNRHPARPEPWHHAARALWGLGLVETALYRDVLAGRDRAREQLTQK